MFGGRARILERKDRHAIEHRASRELGKQRRPAFGRHGVLIQQTMGNRLGADKIMLDIPAPHILRPLDPQAHRSFGADQGLRGQQIKIMTGLGVMTVAVLPSQDLCQPLGQCMIGLDLMARRLWIDRIGHYPLVAIDWCHALPFFLRSMALDKGRCRDQANGGIGNNGQPSGRLVRS
ncbi:hypothetical protein D3C84_924920 [compost metagenome]